eukprot:TRINITY_DN3877_c2_g1_i1.p1 TRINITY_DN3877_c2_g1~~TRINITY_DN3877_c2_g1_i1.p1  ORF type:complete len:466 (+),score=194.32 TRINITY_DN3877_c2_g1_i1:75-1472(+)
MPNMGEYTKVKQIGKGNMGVCHLAKSKTGDLVVIKQVNTWKMNKKEKSQAVGEAKLLKSVNHPNIVRYIDSWMDKNENLMIAMEYVQNGDLCKLVEGSKSRGLWSENKCLDWFIQICLSVHHTGKKHILHRDLKTQNILITQDNVLKLADFGISRSLGNTWEHAHTFVGTPYYLAPELILQQPYNIQVDAWACGVILCELLTLTHPFTGTDMKSLTTNIVKGIYKKPSNQYSPEIRQLVSSLLQKDPKKRMTVKQALHSSICQNRMKEWLKGGVVPQWYLAQLCDGAYLEDVLPSAVGNRDIIAKGEVESNEKAAKPHKKEVVDKILVDIEEKMRAERQKIRSEFHDIESKQLKLRKPSQSSLPALAERGAHRPSPANPPVPGAQGPTKHANGLPPITRAPGAFPGATPSSNHGHHMATPKDLLAEKRRILAMLEKQQQHEEHQRRGGRHQIPAAGLPSGRHFRR